MTNKLTSLALMLLVPATLATAAEEPHDYYIKAGFTSAQADARDMTRNGHGYSVELGTVFAPQSWDGVQGRAYVAITTMKGDHGFKPWLRTANQGHILYSDFLALDPAAQSSDTIYEQRFSYDLRGNVVGMDVMYPFQVANRKMTVFTGPSLHQWAVERVSPYMPQPDRSLRAGWRLGLSTEVCERTSVELNYVITEWRSKQSSDMPYEVGGNPSRPAYITLTASYRF